MLTEGRVEDEDEDEVLPRLFRVADEDLEEVLGELLLMSSPLLSQSIFASQFLALDSANYDEMRAVAAIVTTCG